MDMERTRCSKIFDTRQADFLKKPLLSIKNPEFSGGRLTATKDGKVFALNSSGVTRIYRWKGGAYAETFKGNLPGAGPHWALDAEGKRLWTGAGVYAERRQERRFAR
jgi:hypothetical protein